MSALERLGRRLAEEQDALRADQGAARADVRKRLAQHEPGRAPRRGLPRGLRSWHAAGAAGALAAAAAVALFLRTSESPPLTARVGPSAQPVLPGAWLEAAPGRAPLRLDFSDGTHVELGAGTRARVVEIDARGAHLMIESGLARVSVKHRPDTSYRLSVGPFAVRVIGTRFDVRWDPEHDDFRIDLRDGRVELSGCVFEAGYAMRAGQSLSASCRRGRFQLESTPTRAAAPVVATAQPSAQLAVSALAVSAQGEVERAEAPRAKAQRAAPDWRTLARKGEYAAAYAAAREAGFAAECARADATDLALLAETARYAGKPEDEAEALLLLRRRFAGTPRAALAAFALGRLEFDERHANARAARWFDTYLKEQPEGALSREARGRLLEATLAAGDRTTARTLAGEYLRDHPRGPHGELARHVLEEPAGKRGPAKQVLAP